MFCPKCKVEYRDGFGQCSDCHIDLVSILSQANESLDRLCPKCNIKYPDSCNVCSHCRMDLEASVCPKCKAEYEQWAKQCSDCYVDLISTDPHELAMKLDVEAPMVGELAQVSASDDFHRAQAIKWILERKGIRCCLQNENVASLSPYATCRGVKVFVRKEDAGEAEKIISGMQCDPSEVQEALCPKMGRGALLKNVITSGYVQGMNNRRKTMKTFRYKSKIGSNEFVGSRDAEDEHALQRHIKNAGGELLQILGQTERIEQKVVSGEGSNEYSNRVEGIDLEIEGQLNGLSQKKSSQHSSTILLISVLAFFSLGLFKNSFTNVLVLVAVLFIHELGHLIAMRVFKYRDPSILFIPLLGAVTSGQEMTDSGSRRAIVSLAGPLPGILIGILLGVMYLKIGQEILIETAKVFLILNSLNLLPIYPLDGGQFMNAVLFSRKRKLELGFQAVMVVILLALSFLAKAPIAAFFALMVFFVMLRISFLSSVAERIKSSIPEGQVLSVMPSLPYIEQIREEIVRKDGYSRLTSKVLAVHVLEVWRRICRKPLKWGSALGLFFVYLMALIIGVFSFLIIQGMSLQLREVARPGASMALQRVASKEGDFSILMPSVPQNWPFNPKTSSGNMLSSAYQVNPFFQRFFLVGYGKLSVKGRSEGLDDRIRDLLLRQKGKLIEQKEMTFSGYQGRQVRYEVVESLFKNTQCVVRVFDTAKSGYFLLYGEERRFPSPKRLNMDIANKFFDSFELVVSGNEN